MFSCRKASYLISESYERELTLYERFSLRFHLCICTWCRRFRRQVSFLQEVFQKHQELLDSAVSEGLSPDRRERIRRALTQDSS